MSEKKPRFISANCDSAHCTDEERDLLDALTLQKSAARSIRCVRCGHYGNFVDGRCREVGTIVVQGGEATTICNCECFFPASFQDLLPLTPVRTAPGEYEIRARDDRVLWRMEGASLADWVCASVNGYDAALNAMNKPEKP